MAISLYAMFKFSVAVWSPRLSPRTEPGGMVAYRVPSEVIEALITPLPLRQICA